MESLFGGGFVQRKPRVSGLPPQLCSLCWTIVKGESRLSLITKACYRPLEPAYEVRFAVLAGKWAPLASDISDKSEQFSATRAY